MEKEKIIEVKNLYMSFDDRLVLSDVSFSAYKGEVTVLLGGSGSGKTTILKNLLALYPVQKGSICIMGKELSEISEEEQVDLYLKMGVFYQNGALLNSITVGENVALPLRHQSNLPKLLIEEMVRMKLGLVNLEHAYSQYPSELSGGMLKRAALARAIIMDPPMLFCDEPGAGLDPVSLENLDNLILNLKQQLGMSIVVVTHEITSVLRIADRVIFLDQGAIVFEGTVKQALQSEISSVKDFFAVFRHEKIRTFGR
jgi:phospholipid/cholesterol/gamma-HCH transport system ATP-binding protein